ncbi:hypothetical protein [Zunongwangia sp.]|uniref:hypothetical protein n=1 Tax=Zunongwangia sp. TaxID=1965325 RepID=UPI003AA8FE5B
MATQFLKLTLITTHQNSITKAEKFAKFVCQVLSVAEKYKISEYDKLENAYKIDIFNKIETNNPIEKSIELTDRICSPWLIFYNREENIVELIFNKSESSSFKNQRLNVLNWANFTIESQ